MVFKGTLKLANTSIHRPVAKLLHTIHNMGKTEDEKKNEIPKYLLRERLSVLRNIHSLSTGTLY